MKVSISLRHVSGLMTLTFALGANAMATDILNVTTALTLTDPTQQGRLSRNIIPQDWANTELFPGIVNATTTYHYRTFVVSPFTVELGPFIQISLDDQGPNQANLFASAYFASYNPNSVGSGNRGFDTNWLGDAGISGNRFGIDPVFFQVTAHPGSSLIVVVNNTSAGDLGVGEPFNLLVESFSDTQYSPASAAPEAGTTALLLGLGLAGLVLGQRIASKSDPTGSGF